MDLVRGHLSVTSSQHWTSHSDEPERKPASGIFSYNMEVIAALSFIAASEWRANEVLLTAWDVVSFETKRTDVPPQRTMRLKPSWLGGNMPVMPESEDSSGLPGCKSVPVKTNQAAIRAWLLRLRIYSESTSHHLDEFWTDGRVWEGGVSAHGLLCAAVRRSTLMTLSPLL